MTNPENEDNVIEWNGVTRLKIDPERVLAKAKDRLQSVVIIGYDHDGDEYFSSSEPDGPAVLWLMERMKLKLLTVMTDDPVD